MHIRAHTLLASALVLAACATDRPAPPPVETEATNSPDDLTTIADDRSCEGVVARQGGQNLLLLEDGAAATLGPMTVNVDGSARAYHRNNFEGGAIIHLCNAGQVHLPDGTRYHGSESNATCTGKFMDDLARIEAAGWDDPTVGAIRWYGILGEGDARIAGRTVKGVKPVINADGSGFYVSPTALIDPARPAADPARYVDAITVPHAAVRSNSGVALGTFGVAIRAKNCPRGRVCAPVPFIVGDIGPKIGEGSMALTRAVNGLPFTTAITRNNRFAGNIGRENDDVLWVFFGGEAAEPPFTRASVLTRARAAFAAWGGPDRLNRCLRSEIPLANGG